MNYYLIVNELRNEIEFLFSSKFLFSLTSDQFLKQSRYLNEKFIILRRLIGKDWLKA